VRIPTDTCGIADAVDRRYGTDRFDETTKVLLLLNQSVSSQFTTDNQGDVPRQQQADETSVMRIGGSVKTTGTTSEVSLGLAAQRPLRRPDAALG
jgi:hypothetical protein